MPTVENRLLLQAFEWHTPSQPPAPHETHSPNSHWSRLNRVLPHLANLGVTSIWLPPGCKANNPSSNGYDCYDLWDLGEFDQKWARSTHWGSREELQDLLDTARKSGDNGIDIIWDAVLSHKTAGDTTEEAWAVEVDKDDRRVETCRPRMIEAWLKYDFPGREREGMKYSAFRWRAEHFNGTDWDQKAQKNAIFKLIDDPATCSDPAFRLGNAQTCNASDQRPGKMGRLSSSFSRLSRRKSMVPVRPGKNWADDVTTEELGNYDYLMFSNIYYKHPDVREEILRWGRWMVTDVGIPNFRLDAAQHISRNFIRDWIAAVQTISRDKYGKDAMIIGEIWCPHVSRQIHWLDAVTPPDSSAVLAYTYDTPLLNSFSRVSKDVLTGSRNADLRTLLSGPGHPDGRALVSLRPAQAVTCVSNHDTQAGQSSFTPIDSSLKALFYAFILLRQDGLPCVFWGDLVGIQGPHAEGPACKIPISSSERKTAYEESGSQPPMTDGVLPSLMLARRYFAYGPQRDYLDSMSCIGWTRAGTADRPGCVVIMSIALHGMRTYKKMATGCAGERWVDVLQNGEDRAVVVIGRDGFGVFPGFGGSVGVFVKEDEKVLHQFPADLGSDILS